MDLASEQCKAAWIAMFSVEVVLVPTQDHPALTQVRTFIKKYVEIFFSSTLILFFLGSNCLGYDERCREVEGIKECKQVCVAAVGTPLEFEDNSRPSSSDSASGTYVYL